MSLRFVQNKFELLPPPCLLKSEEKREFLFPPRPIYVTTQIRGSLVVRASDSRPEGLGSMPDATKHPPSTHGSRCRNCGGGDRGRVAIYRPFGELRRAKIVLSPVWCSRPTTGVPLAHATMNFVGLDLTASDSYTRAFGDEPRNFEPWASDEDDTRAGTHSNGYHTTPREDV
ncbi:hypothetical protein TNCV_4746721 [Trichonephila clavipes]|nr:hypothetical protein TNCV_4746721 [Trichonephila clavipes]